MDLEHVLSIADIRLHQTSDLLLWALAKPHQENEALSNALEAIRTAHDLIKNLRASSRPE
jgi:uncharacterized protein YcgI (DUF1989 family)